MLSLLMILIGIFKVSPDHLVDFRESMISIFIGESAGFIWGYFLVEYLSRQ